MKVLVLGRIDPFKPYGWHIRPYYIYKYLKKILGTSKVLSVAVISTCYLVAGLRLFRILKKLLQEITTCRTLVLVNSESLHFIWNIIVKFTCTLLSRQCILITDIHGIMHEQLAIYSNKSIPIIGLIRLLEEFSWKLSDYLIVCSAELAWKIRRRYGNYSVAIVYDSCELEQCVTMVNDELLESLKERYNLNDKTVLVLIAPRSNPANIMAIKFVYKVMEVLLKRRDDIVLVITGGGDPVLEGKPSNVIYTGHLTRRMLFALLKLAKLGFAPYPKGAITGGARNKVLDYWCAGLPIVATREGVSGFTDIVEGVHYVHCEDDPKEFAKTILKLLESPTEELRRVASEAYKLLAAKYNWGIQVRKLDLIVLKLLLKNLSQQSV